MNNIFRSRNLILAVGTFVIGTDAFVVAGIFPELVNRFHVSDSSVGHLVTVFAITYALASPVLGAATSHWERRRVLLAALAVFTIGNIAAALAPDYAVIFAARIVAAVGAAMFTPTAAGTAAMLAAPQARARALAQVSMGLTIATVLGVPAATVLGTTVSFRWTFAVIALAAVLAAAVIRVTFPAVPAQGGATLRQRIGITRTSGVLPTLVVSACAFIGGFTVYNYISPLFASQLKIGATAVAWLLLAFGLGGAAGNFLGGQLADRLGPNRTVALGLILAAGGLALIPVAGDRWAGVVVAILIWAVGGWMQVPAQQHRLISLAGPAAPLAISLNASAMYLGIGLAGVTGALVINTVGLGGLAPFGAIMGLVGLAVVMGFYRQPQQHLAKSPQGAERAG